MSKRREELDAAITLIFEQHGGTMARLSEDNEALLQEYRGCTDDMLIREQMGMEVPDAYRKAVAELFAEIVRRMNRGAGQ